MAQGKPWVFLSAAAGTRKSSLPVSDVVAHQAARQDPESSAAGCAGGGPQQTGHLSQPVLLVFHPLERGPLGVASLADPL